MLSLITAQDLSDAFKKQLEDFMKQEASIAKMQGALMVVAKNKTTISYPEAGKISGVFSGSRKFSEMLYEIFSRDMEAGRPPFVCLVKGNNKETASEGFFQAARDHADLEYIHCPGKTDEEKKEFWQEQVDLCYKYVEGKYNGRPKYYCAN
jgi:hypothetical protein